MAEYVGVSNHDKQYMSLHMQVSLEDEMNQLQEECGELITAISKLRRIKPDAGIPTPNKKTDVIENLIEEMADVVAMIETVTWGLSRDMDITYDHIQMMLDHHLTRKELRFVERKEAQRERES